MKQSLQQRQTMNQEMRLNQFQQQSLHFLQSNVLDLREQIEELRKKFPELQWKDGEPGAWEQGSVEQQKRRRYPGEWRLENQWQNGRFLSVEELAQSSDAKQQMLENYAGEHEAPPDLREVLSEQILLWKLKPEEREFCELVLQNLDEQGFNCENPVLIATTLTPRSSAQKHKLRQLLSAIQQLEPPGCACDSPLHSLRVQARLRYPDGQLAKVLESLPSLEALGSREEFCDYLCQQGLQESQANALLEDLRQLEPYPARGYQVSKSSQSFRIYPEVEVYVKASGELEISLLNNLGAKLEIAGSGRGGETAESKRKRQEAEMILQQLQRREETLLKIVQSVFLQQQNFVRNGIKDMQTLNLQVVAEDIGLHVSTVSRGIQGKYCKTPWGTYPLRFFFSQGARSGQSREQVKERIVEIVREFSLSFPAAKATGKLSDMELNLRLEKLGIQVARRTVAKYRSELVNEGRL